jgi:hypothetical protein
MADRFVLLPGAAEFPASDFPQLQRINDRPVLAFDASTNETARWTAVIPAGWTGTVTAKIYYMMAAATAGDVDIDVAVEAVSDGDALDLDAASSFDTTNSTDNTTVPGTAGYMDVIAVTLTNADGAAAGDLVRFALTRDAASDTAAGDMYVLAVAIADGA